MTDFTGLAEFVAVVESGGFTAAAERLGTTKSVVSQRVRALEARLGSRLLDRTTRRVHLTEAGRVCLDHARRIVDAYRQAEGALQDLRDTPRGRLRIVTTANAAVLFLVPEIAAFRALYPEITVEIVADDAVAHPADAGADVAIRFGSVDRPDVIARRIAPVRYLLCASRDYLDARGAPRTARDLSRHDCLRFRDQAPWILSRGEERVTIDPAAPVHTGDGPVYRALILAGHGIGMINRLAVAPELARGEVVELLPDWRIEGRDHMAVHVVLPDNRAIPPKVRVFVDFVAERLPKLA